MNSDKKGTRSMKYSYYPGCTLKNKAKDLDAYARASAKALGFEMEEIEDWQCCGGVYPLGSDEIATKLSSVRALNDAKEKGNSGVCILSSKKKKPYLADKKFLLKYGFEVVDTVKNEYELLALSFNGEKPYFSESVKEMRISGQELTIYYGLQCPYIPNCIEQVQEYCTKNNIPLNLIAVDTLEKAKNLPCIFNNWAVFYHREYETNHLLNETFLKKKFQL